jgi:L-malate glycosyltransferase
MDERIILSSMIRVLHITPHLGGGVGSVILSFCNATQGISVDNSICCLDYAKSNFESLSCVSKKIDGIFFKPYFNFADNCELIVLHYWNHPLLAKFLSQNCLPKEKLIIWCHNSGLFEPHILPKYLVSISSKVIFSNRCSYAANNLQSLISEFPTAFGCVHSTRNTDEFLEVGAIRAYNNPVKNLLYVGTVDGSKMHPRSAEIFSDLSKQGFLIKVVGGPGHEKLADVVRSLGGEIEIYGEVADVGPFYRNADLFIYPLRPDHYGTGEQVILEAMASGLPVVAFDNPAERAILDKGGGVLASDSQDFVKVTIRLASDSAGYLENISVVGINRIQTKFSIKQMTNNLINIASNIAETSPCDIVDHRSLSNSRIVMDELALYALHSFFDGEEMVSSNMNSLSSLEDLVFEKISISLKVGESAGKWCGITKSTPFHYQRYFQDNVNLNSLCQRITAKCGFGPVK